ncbi:MAG: hypothetical protein ACOX6S_12895 [Clostridia bacterium]|jgi:hypothetical protein
MKIRKNLLLSSTGIGLGLSPILLIYFIIQTYNRQAASLPYSLLILGILFLLIGAAGVFVWLYQMWDFVQKGFPRTNPRKAVGFLLIPFYNFYWVFQAFWGFARDFNRYIELWVLDVEPLSELIFIALSVFTLAAWLFCWIPIIGQIFYIVHYVLLLKCMSQSIDAVQKAIKQQMATPTYY